jgi:putative tryptophan/tyrosine transport system substrate-binding protein
MNRREFITLLGGMAAGWPLAARAQGERMRSVGVLMSIAPDREGQARLAAFLQALQALGWTDGLNVRIETRWGAGNIETIRKFAAELIALGPDVILVSGGTGAGPLLQLTRTVPVVFTQTPDPVGAGFVDSLARPGGNATGFTLSEYGISGKLLEVLKEISPNVTRAAVIRDPAIQQGIGLWSAIQTTAPAFGIEVSPVNMRSAADVEHSMQSFAQLPNGGLIVTGSGLVIVHRELRSANASR